MTFGTNTTDIFLLNLRNKTPPPVRGTIDNSRMGNPFRLILLPRRPLQHKGLFPILRFQYRDQHSNNSNRDGPPPRAGLQAAGRPVKTIRGVKGGSPIRYRWYGVGLDVLLQCHPWIKIHSYSIDPARPFLRLLQNPDLGSVRVQYASPL